MPTNDDQPRVRLFVSCVLVFSAVSAFFIAPIIPFADAAWIELGGISFAAGIAGCWYELRDTFNPWFMLFWSLLAVGGCCMLVYQVSTAQNIYARNQERCGHIEHEMLLPTPRRTDLAELFAALRCVPAANEDIQFPQATSSKPAANGR